MSGLAQIVRDFVAAVGNVSTEIYNKFNLRCAGGETAKFVNSLRGYPPCQTH
jgi:hypothetical protein